MVAAGSLPTPDCSGLSSLLQGTRDESGVVDADLVENDAQVSALICRTVFCLFIDHGGIALYFSIIMIFYYSRNSQNYISNICGPLLS